jgi:tetratricopeptide (TPR) repeat protein
LAISFAFVVLPAYAADTKATNAKEQKKDTNGSKDAKKEETKPEKKKPEADSGGGKSPLDFLFPKPDTNLLINTNLIDSSQNDGNVYFLERKPDPVFRKPSKATQGGEGAVVVASGEGISGDTGLPSQDSTINGFSLAFADSRMLAGIRAKGVADLMVRRGSSSRAIRFYEIALKSVPDEADIWFSLGNIYYEEKVYKIAAKYYKIAAGKYLLPDNAGKTLKFRWQSLIRMGCALEKQRDEENGHQDASDLVDTLREQEPRILKDFPDLRDELYDLYRMVHGEVYVLTPYDFMKPVR